VHDGHSSVRAENALRTAIDLVCETAAVGGL
jgi:hypothetical protein